jgi:hypothetical protein
MRAFFRAQVWKGRDHTAGATSFHGNLGPVVALTPEAGGAGARASETAMTQPSDHPTSHDKPKLNPGDKAEPGTPGTGENVCPDCRGSGKLDDGPCPTCGATGKVVDGVGGA